MKDLLLYNWPLIFIGIFLIYMGVEYVKYQREKEDLSVNKTTRKQSLPETLVLSRFANKISTKQLQLLIATTLILILVLIGIGVSIIASNSIDESVGTLFIAFIEKIQEQPTRLFDLFLMLIMVIVAPLWSLGVARNERLVLSKQGIAYHSPFKGMFGRLLPGWQLSWSELESISLGNQLVRGQLIIKPRQGKPRRLIAHVWRMENDNVRPKLKSIFARLEYERELQQYSLLALEQLPLLRYIQEVLGFTIDTQSRSDMDFDLAKNPRTRLLMILLFGLMAYAIIDFVANDETYINQPPLWWFVSGGLVIVPASVWWLSSKAIPKSSIWGLSFMLGLIMGFALYPGLLRVNQMTDNIGLVQYEYRKVSGYGFKPMMATLPVIIMPDDEYWLSLAENTTISFNLRKGALGFYQIDMAPEYANMRQWYCRQYAKGNPEKLRECEDN